MNIPKWRITTKCHVTCSSVDKLALSIPKKENDKSKMIKLIKKKENMNFAWKSDVQRINVRNYMGDLLEDMEEKVNLQDLMPTLLIYRDSILIKWWKHQELVCRRNLKHLEVDVTSGRKTQNSNYLCVTRMPQV